MERVSKSIFTAIGIGVLLSGCEMLLGCRNQVLEEVPAPSKPLRAVVFQRDCGATTGFSTQVSVLPAGARLPAAHGNAFDASTDRGAAPSGAGGGPEVSVRWVDDTRLLIRHHQKAHIHFAHTEVDGITIEYGLL
jgi:hypothetical protein